MAIVDETMEENVKDFSEAIVGRKIVKVEDSVDKNGFQSITITLDDGRVVTLEESADCCAYTDLESLWLNIGKTDNIITSVTHEHGYTKWHVYAGFNEIMNIDVSWGEGTGYYGYGFHINVKEEA